MLSKIVKFVKALLGFHDALLEINDAPIVEEQPVVVTPKKAIKKKAAPKKAAKKTTKKSTK